jgi:tetratricopeptide (TPR) repeat protein
LEPTNASILVDRGRTYARMGRSQTAKSDFDKALTLDPSNAELRRAIEVEVAELPGQSPHLLLPPRKKLLRPGQRQPAPPTPRRRSPLNKPLDC